MTNTPTPDPVAMALEALKPFAEATRLITDVKPDNESAHTAKFKAGDLRRAAKAYATLSAPRTASDDGRAVEVMRKLVNIAPDKLTCGYRCEAEYESAHCQEYENAMAHAEAFLTEYSQAPAHREPEPDEDGPPSELDIEAKNARPALTAPVQPRQDIAPAPQGVTEEMVSRLARHLCRKEYPTRDLDQAIALNDYRLWMRFKPEARAALEAVWPTHQPDSTARVGALLELALSIRARAAGITMAGLPATADGLVADVEKLEALLSHPEPPAVVPNERVAILEEAVKVETHRDWLIAEIRAWRSDLPFDRRLSAAEQRLQRHEQNWARALASPAQPETDGGSNVP